MSRIGLQRFKHFLRDPCLLSDAKTLLLLIILMKGAIYSISPCWRPFGPFKNITLVEASKCSYDRCDVTRRANLKFSICYAKVGHKQTF